MKDDTRLEELVERCARARTAYEHSEIEYYEFLFSIQETEKDTWGVMLTFETFLEKCVGRPNPAKWTRYVRARKELGLDRIKEIGIPSALEALEIDDTRRRKDYVNEQREWSKQHHGVHASEQYAKEKRRAVDPNEERSTPATNRSRELEKMRAENEALRRENARLKAENVKLHEQLEKLGGKMSPPKGRAPKNDGDRPRA